MVLLAVQLVRFCAYVMLVHHAAGVERHRRRHESQILHFSPDDSERDSVKSKARYSGDDGIYEFGRETMRELEEVMDSEM
jgi:hypothetical protein